ncbi:hypothetical protein BJ742DRAFT_854961 [Cladochytrium replicatum]|nr:hypothetical protein BJ742DRAFT_854961 [Cladochytrium replicatum]
MSLAVVHGAVQRPPPRHHHPNVQAQRDPLQVNWQGSDPKRARLDVAPTPPAMVSIDIPGQMDVRQIPVPLVTAIIVGTLSTCPQDRWYLEIQAFRQALGPPSVPACTCATYRATSPRYPTSRFAAPTPTPVPEATMYSVPDIDDGSEGQDSLKTPSALTRALRQQLLKDIGGRILQMESSFRMPVATPVHADTTGSENRKLESTCDRRIMTRAGQPLLVLPEEDEEEGEMKRWVKRTQIT